MAAEPTLAPWRAGPVRKRRKSSRHSDSVVRKCIINNIEAKTDYIVLLDDEGGKGALRHKNKVAVFARVSGHFNCE